MTARDRFSVRRHLSSNSARTLTTGHLTDHLPRRVPENDVVFDDVINFSVSYAP